MQEGRPFCPSCGRVPKANFGPSYGLSWIFLLVGLMVVLFWAGVRNSQTAATAVSPAQAPPSDDATILVQRCGTPDSDTVVPGRSDTKSLERRWLVYNSAKVRAGFERDSHVELDSPRPALWKNAGYFDATSKKPLGAKQVLKRLPCAGSGSLLQKSD
jgi:hypothetical protein